MSLGIAIVGVGWAGSRHVEAIKDHIWERFGEVSLIDEDTQ